MRTPHHRLFLHEAVLHTVLSIPEIRERHGIGKTEIVGKIAGKAGSTVSSWWEAPRDAGFGSGANITAEGIRALYERGQSDHPALLEWLGAGRFACIPIIRILEDGSERLNASTLDELLEIIRASGEYADVAKVPLKDMNSSQRAALVHFRTRLLSVYVRLGVELNGEGDSEC